MDAILDGIASGGGGGRQLMFNQRKEIVEGGRLSSSNFVAAEKQKNTISTYKSKIGQLINYVRDTPKYNCFYDGSKSGLYEKIILPLGVDLVSDFFELYAYKDRTEASTDETLISRSSASSYRSSIVYLYSLRKMKQPEDEREFIASFLKGFNNVLAERKNLGLQTSREGKDHLRLRDYVSLCDLAMTGKHMSPSGADNELSLMVHSFMTLQWNLIQRARTISDICYDGFEVDNDHFTIMIDKIKNDTTGERQYPRCIHANITNPEVCPVLALALYFFSVNSVHNDVDKLDRRIFRNGSPRFSEWLGKMMKNGAVAFDVDVEDDLKSGDKRSIGSHSLRKGANTHVESLTDGPNSSAVQKRAGWSMGVVDAYLLCGGGQDHYTSRCLSLLFDQNRKSFAQLMPHFHSSIVNETHINIPDGMSYNWRDVISGWDQLNSGFRKCIPYLLARVCHASLDSYLSNKLPGE
jgi:hypothetical protein